MLGQVLVTGGLGYIGSHAVVALQEEGYEVVIIDNCSNSDSSVVDAINEITGVAPSFIKGDVRDVQLLARIFGENKFCAVMHFAGLKAVGDSCERPLLYFDNNINGTLSLLLAMRSANVRTLIFSSSATVYGEPDELPLKEGHRRCATNPYGYSKLVSEDVLSDLYKSEKGWRITVLRYFNPVGAHESGLIGEAAHGVPNNLMPYISQVASGKLPCLRIFGNDYETPDGTGVRDYIHVLDLVQGHMHALEWCMSRPQGMLTVNLGTGTGYSVLEVVAAYERMCGIPIPYEFCARRQGDVASCWADPARAFESLGWKATRDLDDMCRDSWNWTSRESNVWDPEMTNSMLRKE